MREPGSGLIQKGVYDDLRFDRAAANGDELVEPLLSYLTARLKDASVVSAIATFQPYPGGETIRSNHCRKPSLVTRSSAGRN